MPIKKNIKDKYKQVETGTAWFGSPKEVLDFKVPLYVTTNKEDAEFYATGHGTGTQEGLENGKEGYVYRIKYTIHNPARTKQGTYDLEFDGKSLSEMPLERMKRLQEAGYDSAIDVGKSDTTIVLFSKSQFKIQR